MNLLMLRWLNSSNKIAPPPPPSIRKGAFEFDNGDDMSTICRQVFSLLFYLHRPDYNKQNCFLFLMCDDWSCHVCQECAACLFVCCWAAYSIKKINLNVFIIGNMQIFADQVETNVLSSYQCCLCNFVYLFILFVVQRHSTSLTLIFVLC